MSLFVLVYFSVIVFAFGACWGSFMNVCIWRIPREESVVKPRSHCPKCGNLIRWFDNIPIFSWLLLRAKCRHCGLPISPRYILVELLTALLFLGVWFYALLMWNLTGNPQMLALIPAYWLAVFGLLLGTFIDIDHMILPDRVTLGGIVTGLLLSALLPALQWMPEFDADFPTRLLAVKRSVIGMLAGGGSIWAVAIIAKAILKKDAMGFGDVKLFAALGAWFGWHCLPFIIFVSSLLGSVVGLTLIALGKKEFQSRIPFGPYIAVAALFWMLGGSIGWAFYVWWMQGNAF